MGHSLIYGQEKKGSSEYGYDNAEKLTFQHNSIFRLKTHRCRTDKNPASKMRRPVEWGRGWAVVGRCPRLIASDVLYCLKAPPAVF